MSEEYLPVVFGAFFKKLGLPNSMNKSDYCQLAALLQPEEIDAEVVRVLEAILQVSRSSS
ncbi:MAG: hypothetical protein HYU36_21790 [Planctomycetes bacterium]|nr:hypothetical protein [Planctomycetota bacterium]